MIAKIATSLSVSPSPNPVQAGQTSTLTISVTPAPDAGTVSVTDTDGDLSCSNVAVSTSGPGAGTATCTTTGLTPAGSDNLSAIYSGSPNYTSANATGSITVEHIPSSTVITSADSYGVIGGELHVAVKVSPAPSSGTVSFSDSLGELTDCASVGVDATSGDASCASPALTTTGEDVITAKFLQTAVEGASSVSTTIPIEEAPSFSGSLDATVTVGTPAEVQLAVSGYPPPAVSAATALPSGLSLSSSGEITGTAAPGTGGSYAIGLERDQLALECGGHPRPRRRPGTLDQLGDGALGRLRRRLDLPGRLRPGHLPGGELHTRRRRARRHELCRQRGRHRDDYRHA